MLRGFKGRTCELDGCNGWHYAKSLCETHYTRQLRRGRTHLSFALSDDTPGEEWKPVTDFPSYEVSNLGRVRNKFRHNLIKGTVTRYGYRLVGLRVDGRPRWVSVHRLVAIAFIPNVDSLPQVNHKDGVKLNNAVTNLEWCTAQQNIQHAFDTGLNRPWNKKAA